MRALLLVLSSFFVVQFALAQQWYVSSIPHARNAKDVIIKSPGDIQIVGGSLWNDSIESIFRSTSHGLTWDYIRDYPGSSWPESFAYATPTLGTACGTNGKLMRTLDGGLNWSYQQAPVNRDFSKVFYLNNALGFIAGRRETDTMQTIMKTTDGGQTWSVILDQHGNRLNGIAFADAQTGFAVGDKGTLLQTTNGGSTWQAITAPLLRDYREITFLNSTLGYIAGGNDSLRTILVTIDGGANWNVNSDTAGAWLNDITFLNPLKGFAVGEQATFLKTIDGGLTWVPEQIPNANASNPFNAVCFYNDTLGFIGAQGGTCFVYTSSAVPDLTALGAYMLDSTSAMLVNSINTHGYDGAVYFGLATDSNFSTNQQLTYPVNLLTDSPTLNTSAVSALVPNSDYYWIATVYTLAGVASSPRQHFYSGLGSNFYQTNPATQITTGSAQLNGAVNKFSIPVQLSFEYGTTPQMGTIVAATPAQVSDTFSHIVTAQLSGLQALTPYYYRLRCTAGGLLYLGNIQVFFTGNAVGAFQALPATAVGDSIATLNASLSQFNIAASLQFEYGTTPALGTFVQATPASVNDAQTHVISASLTQLQPNSDYYYRLSIQTALGNFVSNTLSFHTGVFYNVFKTLPASNVTLNSAVLNAFAKGVSSPAAISFEYGTTNLMGQQVSVLPDTISDTLAHSISVTLNSLQTNTVYYFRVKGQTQAGVTFYGDIRSFYTGANTIPNFDFEDWHQVTARYPQGWYTIGNATLAQSYDGSRALYLYGDAAKEGGIGFDGLIFDTVPFAGVAFSAWPDSFVFYANYNVVPGDTAWGMAVFVNDGHLIGMNPCPITGNSNGNFVRKAGAISYNGPLNPDTVIIMFASSNWLGGSLNRQSWIQVDNVSFIGTAQNVINPGFENWDSTVYDEALGWASSIREAPINFFPYIPVTKSTDACHGNYAIRLVNMVNVDSSVSSVYITTDMIGGGTHPNFEINHRVSTLDGCMKLNITPGDTMSMYASFFKNGQPVGAASLLVDTNINVYTEFSAVISYNDGQVVPDSASIGFRTFNGNAAPHGQIELLIDNLGFDGFFEVGIKDVPAVVDVEKASLRLYPNPANQQLTLAYTGFGMDAVLQVYDLQGNLLFATKAPVNQLILDVNTWAAGIYLVHITDGRKNAVRKLVIEK